MRIRDLQLLPRLGDSLTFLYVERARVEQENNAIVLTNGSRTSVPVANLSTLMLGPGTSITQAAMVACADNGCSVVFCGEHGVRCYANGIGDTRSSANLLAQAKLWADETARLSVVFKMYQMRFLESFSSLTLEQVRGREGVRVRDTYAKMSEKWNVPWSGRSYSGEWNETTPINQALSAANACLYGLCHAAIVSIGLSPALGFIHTGKALSFVYDIADLYKTETTIPAAFRAVASGSVEKLRAACRDEFRQTRLMERIIPDMQGILGLRQQMVHLVDATEEEPQGELWGPNGNVAGEQNYGRVGR